MREYETLKMLILTPRHFDRRITSDTQTMRRDGRKRMTLLYDSRMAVYIFQTTNANRSLYEE